jgi:hypothetical protein
MQELPADGRINYGKGMKGVSENENHTIII